MNNKKEALWLIEILTPLFDVTSNMACDIFISFSDSPSSLMKSFFFSFLIEFSETSSPSLIKTSST